MLHDVLFNTTETFIAEARLKGLDTTSDDFLSRFSYVFLDRPETGKTDAQLDNILKQLLGPKHRQITELNLALANGNTDWRSHPIEWAIVDYLNDFLNYVMPRVINLDDWRVGFEKHYQSFEADHLSDDLTVDFFGHIGNFSYRYRDTGELNDHTKIVVLHTWGPAAKHENLCNQRADFFRVSAALHSCFPEVGEERWSKAPYFLHFVKRFKKRASGTPQFDAYQLMRKFVLALRLLSPRHAKPYCDFVAAFYQGRLSGSTLSRTASFPEDWADEHGWVDFEYGSWLRRLWGKLEVLDYSQRLLALDHHLDDALRRGIRSERNPYSKRLKIFGELERLSDYFSAFDSIYKSKPTKTTATVSVATARLMTYKPYHKELYNPREWEKIRAFMKEMYDIRGDYEHGRVGDALRKAGRPEQFSERVSTVEYYLKQVAITYIMNDDFDGRMQRIISGDCKGLRSLYD